MAGLLFFSSVLAAQAVTSGGSFAPTCKAGPVTQPRPEPAWVGQSFADDHCVAPPVPTPVDGTTARREKIVDVMAAHTKYDRQAQAYQRCIRAFVDARQAKAEQAKQRVNVALLLIENHRIAASRAARQSVAQQTDRIVNQFNAYGSSCPD